MNRFAYATYCDDVRYELNGKTSLIGVYADTMFIPAFPAHLPKLCVVVTAVTPSDTPFKDFAIKATYNGTTLGELVATADQMAAQVNAEPTAPIKSANAQLIFSPIALPAPGSIEITFTSEGQEIKCNALAVSQLPEGMILQPA